MNFDQLHPNTQRLVARFYNITDDGSKAVLRAMVPDWSTIEQAVIQARKLASRKKQRAYVARKRGRA